jgi:hypothetical protein
MITFTIILDLEPDPDPILLINSAPVKQIIFRIRTVPDPDLAQQHYAILLIFIPVGQQICTCKGARILFNNNLQGHFAGLFLSQYASFFAMYFFIRPFCRVISFPTCIHFRSVLLPFPFHFSFKKFTFSSVLASFFLSFRK